MNQYNLDLIKIYNNKTTKIFKAKLKKQNNKINKKLVR